MKLLEKYKIDKFLLISIFLFIIISLITVYSSQSLLDSSKNSLVFKQLIWYIVGFLLIFFIMFIGNKNIYKYAWILYIIGNISLLLLLIFGTEINNAKCWFTIPGIGTIQPSEFMKIFLIIILGKLINDFNNNYLNPSLKEEFLFLLKIGIIVLIPSVLTFLQPDTGVVLIYLLITLVMLFISGIRYRWFFIFISILLLLIGSVVITYKISQDLFIKIFSTSFFLRVDRLLDWSNGSGYQLSNGLISIGSGGILGHGFNNTPLYFPEPQTDFIFAVFSSNFGLIGSLLLFILIAFFDIKLIGTALKSNSNINKYIISGIVGMLIYQQFQNIGMTIGLMPITGITLPFISYGGSSLLSYMIMIGIIFNISNENLKYKN
ncbi:MAG: FtsW/RodA/SpoVE family cell cycle protein [Lactobacillales bacterium]|nr:FtsW/RodA/SpoVE family cell cycle protein [Lactobacillales bacterium]